MTTKRKEVVEAIPEKTREIAPFAELDRLFDRLFHRGGLSPFRDLWAETPLFGEVFEARTPRMDIVDREDEILVRAELPGVKKDDLQVDLSGQTLTIKGEHREEEKEEKGDYYRAEITRGSFSRRIQLPEEVDGQQIDAEFKDGVLEVHLPKLHKVERRKIEVK